MIAEKNKRISITLPIELVEELKLRKKFGEYADVKRLSTYIKHLIINDLNNNKEENNRD